MTARSRYARRDRAKALLRITHRVYPYGCVRKVWVCTYIRVQDPRSTFKVENIEVHICLLHAFRNFDFAQTSQQLSSHETDK